MINQTETHTAAAIVLESGTVFKIKYLDDAHGWSNSHNVIPLANQYKILSQKDSIDGLEVKEGSIITVILGNRQDRRLGLLTGVILGFRS